MPEFQLDTDGAVALRTAHSPAGAMSTRYDDLDAFTQGYVEALFFTEYEEIGACGMHGDEIGTGFSDLAPDTLATIIADCAQFQRDADQILADCYCREGYSPKQAGRDFWSTRNCHGVGFWDRDALKADSFGDVLTGIAQDDFPEISAYLGDDGKIYIS